MGKVEKKLVNYSNNLVIAVGLIYAVIKYFLKAEGEFGPISHPWQPILQYLHILTVPALIFSIGCISFSHIVPKLKGKSKKNKKTGVTLIFLFILMSFSGYLLQTSVYATARDITIWLHVALSLLWSALFFVHRKV